MQGVVQQHFLTTLRGHAVQNKRLIRQPAIVRLLQQYTRLVAIAFKGVFFFMVFFFVPLLLLHGCFLQTLAACGTSLLLHTRHFQKSTPGELLFHRSPVICI